MDEPLILEEPELPGNCNLGGVCRNDQANDSQGCGPKSRLSFTEPQEFPDPRRRVRHGAGHLWATGPEAQELVSSSYARKVIGKVSELEPGKAMAFNYPTDDIENLVMMLNEEAGGGVGEGRNIVAFNTICPHMGGYMGESEFKSQHSVLGPCPLHLSTFDLSVTG